MNKDYNGLDSDSEGNIYASFDCDGIDGIYEYDFDHNSWTQVAGTNTFPMFHISSSNSIVMMDVGPTVKFSPTIKDPHWDALPTLPPSVPWLRI